MYNCGAAPHRPGLSGILDWIQGVGSDAWGQVSSVLPSGDDLEEAARRAAAEAGEYLRRRMGEDAYASLTPAQRAALEREYARQRMAELQPQRALVPLALLALVIFAAK